MKVVKPAKKEVPVEMSPTGVPKEIADMRLNYKILRGMRTKAVIKKEKAEWEINAYQMGMDMIENELEEMGYELEG